METRLPAIALVLLFSRSLLPSARPPTIVTLTHPIPPPTLRPNASIPVRVDVLFAPATQLVEPAATFVLARRRSIVCGA